MVRDIFRKIFINGIPFKFIFNDMANWIDTIENAKWNTPFPMLNYFRKNKQQQNFKNCIKKIMEFGKKNNVFIKSIISGKNDRELYKMHRKRMATVVQFFLDTTYAGIQFCKISIGRCISTEFLLQLFFYVPETISAHFRSCFRRCQQINQKRLR